MACYWLLTNGLIIQWGKAYADGYDTEKWIPLTTAFTSENYFIVLTSNTTIGQYNLAQPNWVRSKQTTKFHAHFDAYTDSTGADWFAIGQ